MIQQKSLIEILSVVMSPLLSSVVTAILMFWLMRPKTNAEIEKTETETEKAELENYEKLRQLVNELAGDVTKLRRELNESNALNAELTARLNQVEETVKNEQSVFKAMLTQKNKEISGLKKDLKTKIETFEKQIQEKDFEIQSLRGEVDGLKAILEAHNLQIDN